MDDRKETGDRCEEAAARYLERLGWKILARNVRWRVGELDIVADDGTQLVFVEVRSRRRQVVSRPEDTVRSLKQSRLERAARMYMARHCRGAVSARFDVIGVDGWTLRVTNHIRAAFEAQGG